MDSSQPINALVDRLTEIVGVRGLLFDPAEVELVTRTSIPYRQIPDVVVYPESAAQVQKIVTVAQELTIPIWTVSTGKNWGYGTKSAAYPGGITLVLERMKKIELVEEDLAYAVIEPGVTYRDLNRYLKEHKLALWSDSPWSPQSRKRDRQCSGQRQGPDSLRRSFRLSLRR